MGAAESSNTSESVTKLANTIQQSTKADTNQVNNLANSVDFTDCTIKLQGDFNVTSSADLFVSNKQIADAKQDANLQNNVEQTAMQQAKSSVGALGVGFATANNAAKQLVDVSNKVTNDLFVTANQFSNTSQNFNCNRSYIEANNLNIEFSSKANFLSDQALKNSQTAKIVNDIKQTVDQKATATVEGLTGLLFMLILLICAIGYFLFKPLDTQVGKIIILTLIICTIVGVFIWMWATEKPPLFGKPDECIASSQTGKGNYPCKNVSRGQVQITGPPLRYSYPVLVGTPNLVQMVIAKVSGVSGDNPVGVNNGGYNVDVMNKIQTQINNNYEKYTSDLNASGTTLTLEKIPNPLINLAPEGKIYQVPPYYKTDSNAGGKCTPKIIQVSSSSLNTNLEDCPTEVNPSALTTIDITSSNQSGGIANLNTAGWNEYLGLAGSTQLSSDELKRRNDFARFCLCDILDVELNIYVDGSEYIKIVNTDGRIIVTTGEKSNSSQASKFVPSSPVTSSSDKIVGGGVVQGDVGVVENKATKISEGVLYVGLPIFVIMVMIFIYVVLRKKKDNQPQGKK